MEVEDQSNYCEGGDYNKPSVFGFKHLLLPFSKYKEADPKHSHDHQPNKKWAIQVPQ